MAQSELEIGLHRRDAFLYTVELRYVSPAGGADDFVAGEARLDFDKLRSFGLDDAAYGSELSQSLFGDQSLRVRFAQVLKAAEVQDDALRLRLFIGPTAPELQTLRWERLRDPESNRPLFTKHRVHFSRYLSSRDWRPVQMRTRSSLRALLVIANPENLAEKGLPPIDPKLELELAESSLQEANVVKLVGRGEATLENVLQHQLRGGYDILYLVCHGVFDEKRSRAALYLENAHGKAEFVDGTEFAHRLEELSTRPRLIVLASCDSAGSLSDDENAPNQLAALGPRLSQAGIPAVIAMQGRISMETGKAFMKVFFEELQKDGVVDRAASVARSAVQDRPDWWKPVLFMRLRTGRLWYSRGLDKGRLDQWDVLVRKIEKQKCTPILGPALNDYLLGGRREIVRRWAEREHYPLALDRESLPQVAQYLKSRHDSFTMRDKLNEFFSSELRQTYGADLHQVLRNLLGGLELGPREMEKRVESELEELSLNEIIRLVGGQYIETDPFEPHRVLARLGLPLYITTNANDLLADGIRYHGREPRVELYRWKDSDDVEWPPSIFDENPGWHLSREEPLVYHLFGHLSRPETVVLSEDDYFDYLMGLDRNKSRLPPQVGSALNDSSLLFLGFRMDDWGFRVLFRSLMRRGGAGLRTRHAHVAVQIDPEGEFTTEPENARLYLTKYFGSENISLYWGSPRDFVEELSERLGAPALALP
jgi:hypothetical protein